MSNIHQSMSSDEEFKFEEEEEFEPLPFIVPPPLQIPGSPLSSIEGPSPPVLEGDYGFADDSGSEGSFDLLNLIVPVVEDFFDESDTSTIVSWWEGFHDLWDFMTDSESETVVEEWEGYAE